MPQGSQSLVPLSSTNFTAVDGTTYKGQIDAFTAVASQIGGPFYVTPTSPASMVVLVDALYTFFPVGLNPIVNGISGPSSAITLTAPASLSHIGTVYWDFANNVPGVIYSFVSATPVPLLPMFLNQQPIALVTISSTATSITASNIEDCRGFNQWAGPLSRDVGPFPSSNSGMSTNVAGATNITTFCSRTNVAFTGAFTLFYINYRIGTPVHCRFDNGVSGSVVFAFRATTPDGVELQVQATGYGGSNTIVVMGGAGATGQTVVGGGIITLIGNSLNGFLNLTAS